MVFNVIELM